MTNASVADLVDTIRRCRLLEPAQEEELTRTLQPRFPDLNALAQELVRRGWLTPYQAHQLVRGRGPDLLVGRYVVLERLGRGGMGQVFKARHRDLGRVCALKLLRKEYLSQPLVLQRFCREAHAMTQLAHPNIVKAHETGQTGSVPFLAMEYIEGIDLARLVERSGPLPIPQACDCARQAALGLQHAHERGVVHRDVKPRNLLVTRASPRAGAVVKVLDFGLALLGSETAGTNRLTRLGRVVGTADYMAPEQVTDCRVVDGRADIYSLGCSLFYLLTARPPFVAEDQRESMTARLREEAPPVQRFRAEVAPALGAVLAKMLAQDPGRRYQTPAEVAAALEPFCPAPAALARPAPSVLPDIVLPEIAGEDASAGSERAAPGRWRLPALAGATAILLMGMIILFLFHPSAGGPHAGSRPGKNADRQRGNTGAPRRQPDGPRARPWPPAPEKNRAERRPRKKEEVEEEPVAPQDGRPAVPDRP